MPESNDPQHTRFLYTLNFHFLSNEIVICLDQLSYKQKSNSLAKRKTQKHSN
jgi:hypothetical protein